MDFISKIRFIRYTFDCQVKKYSIHLSASQMLERHLRADREILPVTLFLLVFFFFTSQLIRFFVKVSFKKVSFWEILSISALDIDINVDDTSPFFLQFASSFQLLVHDTFDSCRKWRLRYICDLHIIHHYLYKKCTCFCNKVHHIRKTKSF